jgi:hypothetical protein
VYQGIRASKSNMGAFKFSNCTPFDLQKDYQKNATVLGTFSYVRKLHVIVLDLRSHIVTLLYLEMKI